MGRKPEIANAILRVLAECRCVSRRAFDLIPYSYVNTSINLKKLVDSGAIQLSGKGADKRYTLLENGWKMLYNLNPERYPLTVRHDRKLLGRHPERETRKGDTAAAISQALFAVHADDKPALPVAYSPARLNEQGGWGMLYHNEDYQYYDESIQDNELYIKRTTPINCYYESHELKRLFADKNSAGIRYSRACGVLLTPDHLYRVFHSGGAVLELRMTGEKKLEELLHQAFRGYYPKKARSLLVFGDSLETGAKILASSSHLYNKAREVRKHTGKPGELLTVTNTGVPLIYLPITPDSLPLLSLLKYPGWQLDLNQWVASQYRIDLDFVTADGLFAVVDGNWRLYVGIDMDLSRFDQLMRFLNSRTDRHIFFVCLEWQIDFYKDAAAMHLTTDEGFDCIEWKIIADEVFADYEDDMDCQWA